MCCDRQNGRDEIPGEGRVQIFPLHRSYFEAKKPFVFQILEVVISFGFVSLPKKVGILQMSDVGEKFTPERNVMPHRGT